MNRRITFVILRFLHLMLDRTLSPALGNGFRQNYIRFSYRVKTFLFPEYGSKIPNSSEINGMPSRVVWNPPPIPKWVLDEMKEIAREIDPILYPTNDFIAKCQYYEFPVIPTPGKIYWSLLDHCSADHYTHCFAIPWLKRGGSDLVTLAHLDAVMKVPGNRVLVIMTEVGDSPWKERIPASVDLVDASQFIGDVSHEDFLTIIVRMLVQLRIDNLHIINSRHVWEIACRYGLALTQRTRIFGSLYCDDFNQYGQPVGFARQYLPECHRLLTAVLCDNSEFPAMLRKTYGYNKELFYVLHSPVDFSMDAPKVRKPPMRRVLWAGRLDRQKRPDILLAIAQSMQDVDFDIYGEVTLDKNFSDAKKLATLPNVRMLGGFDGVESIPFDAYSIFLYTSQWDGTPTMVIAAALTSIPIVASRVGGVGDIVNEERGYPVDDIENVELYIKRIGEALDDPLLAELKGKAAREYVIEKHSAAAFSKALNSIPHYMLTLATSKIVTTGSLE